MLQARSLPLLLVLCVTGASASCTDTAVVGVNLERGDSGGQPGERCDPACSSDELCHPSLHTCVRCMNDDDCVSHTGAPFCDAQRFVCVACRSAIDCADFQRCDDGICHACDEGPVCVDEHCQRENDACRDATRGPGPGSGGNAGNAGNAGSGRR